MEKIRQLLFSLAFGVAVFLTGFGQTEDQKQASVKVHCQNNGCLYAAGGFLIEGDWIITAAHVAAGVNPLNGETWDNDPEWIKVITEKGEFDASLAHINRTSDIAVLRGPIPAGLARLKLSAKPALHRQKLSLLTRAGKHGIDSICRMRKTTAEYDTTDDRLCCGHVMGGDSGSCWLNESGEVVGVVSVAIGDPIEPGIERDGTVYYAADNSAGPGLKAIRAALEAAK